ncbi:MAG: glutathione S-transferase family protein [Phaeobacter italicus]|jgi:glutathione S-transferase|uniref:Glutathione S-transferase GST-4.5 n=1 Tax=Phaeobacter italicus TaxID=481446 RepID=A0A0H5D427_9RHOB|nr:glutathione S-transferase [Phaeobacter italicus]MEC8016143.1 glutathione S-transferase [Pseudomonadota bacterium]MBO9441613.1 glutathione S-transferase [Phaeobacter italicus]MBY5976655.1 glutathione S-transferase [Phaeobacter italicus]MBY6044691.1 glutathione S-transferase [Phaeobacter italicus]MCA0855523.1 glutathione S-transferase [Phaeobacter italicus]
MTPIKLYRNPKSGHCHRVELLLAFLGLPYETIDLDMANGAHKAPEYLKISPFGKVPAIDDSGYTLSDSNAILVYLVQTYAKGSHWLPEDPKTAAEVQRWLTIAADNIFSGPCSARLVTLFGAQLDHAAAIAKSHDLFKLMETHLNGRNWLAAETITIADIAGYSYIAHAPEGGVDLAPYPNLRAWLNRIEAEDNFVPMVASEVPELA